MTAHAPGLTAIRVSHRTIKLIWTVLAVVALAAVVTMVVLVSTPSHHAANVAPGYPPGPGTADQCAPSRLAHPC